MKPYQIRWTQKWLDPPRSSLPDGLSSLQPLPKIALRLLQRQGIRTAEEARAFMDHHLYTPATPYELPQMEAAVERTLKAIKRNELIGVWGDFDVDGQSATAVLVSALRQVGARVIYHVPVRGPESHGIKLEVLQKFISTGVSLLITCDTGISERESVAWAQASGVDVIVTDHHSLPDELPRAFALVNSQFLEHDHPMRPLPGVGVAYKFAEALLERFGQADTASSLYDLTALGIVADVADLRADARYLTQSGLNMIRMATRPSLRAMLQVAEVDVTQFSEESISFVLAPRLNAMGRLGDANEMVEFLLSEDPALIAVTVNRLEGLNARRKLYCEQVFQGALDQIQREPGLLDHPVLMLAHEEWRAGVVGIVASRLVQLYHRPVILFVSPPDELMSGSARSVEGINIISAIRRQADLLTSFGGHPMAAGLSLPQENFKQFQRAMDQAIEEELLAHPLEQTLQIDAWMQPQSIDLALLDQLEKLAPYGAGNPPPVFAARKLSLVSETTIGKLKEHRKVTTADEQGNTSQFLWWQGAGMPLPEGRFDLAFNGYVSTYQGKRQISLEWLDYRPEEEEKITLSAAGKTRIEHFDHRGRKDRILLLRDIIQESNPEIYREGLDRPSTPGKLRFELEKNDTLVIWSLPPSQIVLDQIVENVKPNKILWFGDTIIDEEPGMILKSVAKEVKTRIQDKQSLFDPILMAAERGTTDTLLRLILRWLAARGDICLEYLYQETAVISSGGTADSQKETELRRRIKKELDEIQAFRRYYLHSSPSSLFPQE